MAFSRLDITLEGTKNQVAELGTTIKIRAQMYDDAGAAVDPDNDIMEFRIEDPNSTVKADWTEMTPDATGDYSEEYQTATTDIGGAWLVFVRGRLAASPNNYLMNKTILRMVKVQ